VKHGVFWLPKAALIALEVIIIIIIIIIIINDIIIIVIIINDIIIIIVIIINDITIIVIILDLCALCFQFLLYEVLKFTICVYHQMF
jgi:hypothetical protein